MAGDRVRVGYERRGPEKWFSKKRSLTMSLEE